MTLALVIKILQIVVIDVVLSGDNAVVIAMAAHKLPPYQRQRAILWGGLIAIVLRVVFTMLMAFLLMIPGVRLIGGIVLVGIACKLLLDEENHAVTPDNADKSTFAAIRMIFVADFVMSLDNMLAVAGAAGEQIWLLVFGLLVSIGIIMLCSAIIARWMNRYPLIVYLGAAILAYTAGKMMLEDRELASYFARTHHVSLDSHWEEDFMLTRGDMAHLPKGTDELPDDLKDVVRFHGKKLEFVGQMTAQQRDELLSCVSEESDVESIEKMYQNSHRRDVPDWVPDALQARAEPWFQRKWPADVWHGVQGRQYHYVAWVWYALVIVFCMTSPSWWRRRATEKNPTKDQPAKN